MPKISVIVPVYKVEDYLNRCVDSILDQTYKDFELILVDDGSPDNCGQMCEGYAAKDSRVFVIHKKNGGLSDARNAGIERALQNGCEYIVFIDSDDWVSDDYLEKLYDAAEQNGSDLAVCAIKNVYDESWKGEDFKDEDLECETVDKLTALKRIRAKWSFVVAWNKLYKASIFNNVRYPVGKIHEDEYVIHRIIQECEKVTAISDKLYYYFHRGASIMGAPKFPNRFNYYYALFDRAMLYGQNGYKELLKNCIDDYFGNIALDYKFLRKNKDKKTSKQLIKIMERHGQELGKLIDYSVYDCYQVTIDKDNYDFGEKVRSLKYYYKQFGLKRIIKKVLHLK